ncbi:unnamed protein product [Allacma fusca]|uniref:RRM domain-containing protein n=1 Tax=Allacma fusca TaxID=39272 RepID=A0A8J2LPI1_9HEXA|nr:unnamed protein product [Allacma fusca]
MGSTGSKDKSSNENVDEKKLSTPILVEKLPELMTADLIRLEFPNCAKIVFPPTTQEAKKAQVYFRTNADAIRAYHQSSMAKGDLFRLSWKYSTKRNKHSSVDTSLSSKSNSNIQQPAFRQSPSLSPANLAVMMETSSNGNTSPTKSSIETIRKPRSEHTTLIKEAVAMSSLFFKPNEIMITNLPEDTATLVTQLKRVAILYTRDVELSQDATFITIRFKREDDTEEMVNDFKSANFLEIQPNQFSWNESDEAVIWNLDPFQRFGDFGCGMGHNSGSCQTTFQLEICYVPSTTTKSTLLEDFPSAYHVKINASAVGQIGILRFGPMGITEWNYNRAKKIFKGHNAQIRLMKIQKYPAPIDIINIPEYFTWDLVKEELPAASRVDFRMINKVGRRARIQFNTEREAREGFEAAKKIRFFQTSPKIVYDKDKKIILRQIQASHHSKGFFKENV